MRIAQVAPLFESVPPKAYGGTERVVSYLTEELVRQNHDVTLFASGDSITSARLVSCSPRSLRLSEGYNFSYAHHALMFEKVRKMADEFDVIHFHTDYLHFGAMRGLKTPYLTTFHGRLDIQKLGPLYEEFSDNPAVSISENQRKPLPNLNWIRTVHHGL